MQTFGDILKNFEMERTNINEKLVDIFKDLGTQKNIMKEADEKVI